MTSKEAAKLAQLRILKNVKKTAGCWIWIGPVSWSSRSPEQTYGYVSVGGKKVAARRASYEAFHVQPPMGNRVVGCKCQHRLCVNPKHLYLKDQGKSTGRNGGK